MPLLEALTLTVFCVALLMSTAIIGHCLYSVYKARARRATPGRRVRLHLAEENDLREGEEAAGWPDNAPFELPERTTVHEHLHVDQKVVERTLVHLRSMSGTSSVMPVDLWKN